MKATTRILFVVMAVLPACILVACGNKASKRPLTFEDGIEEMRAALAKASPEVQSNLYNGVIYSERYGKHLEALAALDQIASDPSLNANQKKLVSDVIDLLKPKLQAPQNAPEATK